MSDVTSTAQLDTPRQAAVAAALVVLERMGLSPRRFGWVVIGVAALTVDVPARRSRVWSRSAHCLHCADHRSGPVRQRGRGPVRGCYRFADRGPVLAAAGPAAVPAAGIANMGTALAHMLRDGAHAARLPARHGRWPGGLPPWVGPYRGGRCAAAALRAPMRP